MVTLNKIYTKTGDGGETGLGTGERVAKTHPRIEAIGAVDETNAAIGVARGALGRGAADQRINDILKRIQNDLFDLGADLCAPDRGEDLGYEPLRIIESQVARLESDIDTLNADLEPLKSFILPAGAPAAAGLHLARTVCRRAERRMIALTADDSAGVSQAALKYINRLSDLLFVACRAVNAEGPGDVLWTPGGER
ncbi:MAG: cob(I)yrinic acid a,c-diamide adenosyltransferase [Pseudomonadota bacterium]